MLGLGVGLLKASLKRVPAWLSELKSRVVADGGSTENSQCIKSDIRSLQSIERTSIILTLLEIDLDSEGGTLEARECLVNSMEELHTIL